MAERTVVAEYMVWQDAMSQFWLIGRLFAPVDQLPAKPDPDTQSNKSWLSSSLWFGQGLRNSPTLIG